MKTLLLVSTMLAAPWLMTLTASAQPLHVEVEGIAQPEALTGRLAEDLDRVVTTGEGWPMLRVVVAPGGRATLTFTLGDGTERTRTVEVSAEEEAAIVELTLIGSNLVRDQTEGLIGDAPIQSPPSAPESTDPVQAAPTAPISSMRLEEPALELNLAEQSRFNFGFSGFFGVQASGSRSEVEPFGTHGLSLSGTVASMVSLGVTRVELGFGASSLEGLILSLQGTPFVELFGFLDTRVQVYAQLGVALQGRSQTSLQEGLFQVAPYLGGGLRFWVVDHFSIGVELGAHVVLTDAYFVSGTSLPKHTVPATIGLSAEWHITP